MEKTVILQRLLAATQYEEISVAFDEKSERQREVSQLWRYDGARAKKVTRYNTVLKPLTSVEEPTILSPGDKFQIAKVRAGAIGGVAPYKIKILGKYKGRWLSGITHNEYKLIIAKAKKMPMSDA